MLMTQVFTERTFTTLFLCHQTKEVFNYKHLTKTSKEPRGLSVHLKITEYLFDLNHVAVSDEVRWQNSTRLLISLA